MNTLKTTAWMLTLMLCVGVICRAEEDSFQAPSDVTFRTADIVSEGDDITVSTWWSFAHGLDGSKADLESSRWQDL